MRHRETILQYVNDRGLVTAKEVEEQGLPPRYLSRLVQTGDLVKLGRGLYAPAGKEWTIHHSLAEAAKAIPSGVVCLISALAYHEIGTQLPHTVWIAVPRGMKIPKSRGVKLRVVTMTPMAYDEDITTHTIEGVQVQIYSAAKTVVDCFRLKKLVGLDVALEALKDGLRQKKFTPDEILNTARQLDVDRTIRPYVEALII